MTFERLVRHEQFVSELLTTTVGKLRLARPAAVRRADAKVGVDPTAVALQEAHDQAVGDATATMITSLAVPFVGLESAEVTPVKPDFAVVAPRYAAIGGGSEAGVDTSAEQPIGSWLVMGDAKDYERVRTRIDDARMFRGFLQVAIGAESVERWSALPEGMLVHRSGALAVPRNAFLQPTSVVERLDDHRAEVRAHAEERLALLRAAEKAPGADDGDGELDVAHLQAAFDPATCPSCSLFNYCRNEIREMSGSEATLIEIGVPPDVRPVLLPVAEGQSDTARAPEPFLQAVLATRSGRARSTGALRTDPAGGRRTVNVVLAKSDSSALGVHGIGIQRVGVDGASEWSLTVFDDPQSPATRLQVLSLVGDALDAAMSDAGGSGPVHLVTPDTATGDLLVSIADSAAGIEISRLRWDRDREVGRPPLTFDGQPARVPAALTDHQRLAVSYLLDQDRGRAMLLRESLVDLREVMHRHFVPGGVISDAGRLDYLVRWASAPGPVDHRELSDEIGASTHTPGARLSNTMSDTIHDALRAVRGSGKSSSRARLESLVLDELRYKASVVDAAIEALRPIKASRLREIRQEIERAAQAVWRRRMAFHASDLVRFGRVPWYWRNALVELIESDARCAESLAVLGNPLECERAAKDAGTRLIASAEVLQTEPLRLRVDSRRIGADTSVALISREGRQIIEDPEVELKVLKGSFKFRQVPMGPLETDDATGDDGGLTWLPKRVPQLAVGDHLVVASTEWFNSTFASGHEFSIKRPGTDTRNAPGRTARPTRSPSHRMTTRTAADHTRLPRPTPLTGSRNDEPRAG